LPAPAPRTGHLPGRPVLNFTIMSDTTAEPNTTMPEPEQTTALGLKCKFCDWRAAATERPGRDGLMFRRDVLQQLEDLRLHVRVRHSDRWHGVQKMLHRNDAYISAAKQEVRRARW
jgi:hypothetical protein